MVSIHTSSHRGLGCSRILHLYVAHGINIEWFVTPSDSGADERLARQHRLEERVFVDSSLASLLLLQ